MQHQSRNRHQTSKRFRDTNVKKKGNSSAICFNNNEDSRDDQLQKNILPWPRMRPIVLQKSEDMLLPLLLKYGAKENGMMCKQPAHRVQKIYDACKKHDIGIDQALSLRRTHMMNMNQFKRHRLNLGTLDNIKDSANIFEDIVKTYLICHSIAFWTEEEQKNRVQNGTPLGPTPDFLFQNEVQLQISDQLSVPIFWLEAKMFYGASTIPHGSRNAVGGVFETAKRYKQAFGPGAIVFSFGYGEKMKSYLETDEIYPLDANVLDLRPMFDHQRTWCATKDGHILP